jgi:probable phosphoglycerate mutase
VTDVPAGIRRPDGSPLIPEGLDATLVLVRHGESAFIAEGRFQGQAETPLTAAGRMQAALVGRRLAGAHDAPALPVPGGRPHEIVHSPLARTRETAEAIADAMAVDATGATGGTGADTAAETATGAGPAPPLRAEPGLLELMQGEWQGVTHDDIARRWPAELAAWRRRPWESVAPGGESLAHVQDRVRPALARVLDELGRDYPRGTFDRPQVGGYRGVGQAHDQPWSILVGHDGVFKIVFLTLFDLPVSQFWMIGYPLCGITVVELRGGRPVLRAHGLTDHLSATLDEATMAAADERARSGAL